jgi:two-component system, LytTR family, response regulator
MSDIRLLVVDDEPLIRLGIRSGLAKLQGVSVLGECATGAEAIRAIAGQPLDLVLLDVQLPDCTGFDVVNEVGAERMPMVIFATAFEEYAVRAFDLNAVDYLLKPFDEDRLRSSIERARQRLQAFDPKGLARQLQELLKSSGRPLPERIVVRHRDHFEFVPVEAIDWIESANNYIQLHCATKTHLVTDTMSNMEKKLDSRQFRRVHRQHIVNIGRVVMIHPIMNGSYELELRNGVRVASGRQYKATIQELMQT